MIKIAIVDDEISILKVLEKFLSKSGKFNITTYTNPVVAVDSIDSSFDIILMDIMMPQLNGIEALEQILAKNPNQKVIMMTAFSTLDKVLESHKIGASNYLMKPFNSLIEVQRKIEEIIKE